jgi:hypothetical protein
MESAQKPVFVGCNFWVRWKKSKGFGKKAEGGGKDLQRY